MNYTLADYQETLEIVAETVKLAIRYEEPVETIREIMNGAHEPIKAVLRYGKSWVGKYLANLKAEGIVMEEVRADVVYHIMTVAEKNPDILINLEKYLCEPKSLKIAQASFEKSKVEEAPVDSKTDYRVAVEFHNIVKRMDAPATRHNLNKWATDAYATGKCQGYCPDKIVWLYHQIKRTDIINNELTTIVDE